MNQDNMSSWTLAFSVALLIFGVAMIAGGKDLLTGGGLFLLAAVFALLTWRFRVEVRNQKEKARMAQEEADRKAEEESRRRKEERERKAREEKEERDRWRYIRFPVAGVTFKNEDGTDRQAFLREVALNEDGRTEVWFDEDEDLGEASAIKVMTEYGCVGFIRRSDKSELRRFFGRTTQSSSLEVERFTNDDGQSIYRADVYIIMKRDDPEQAWYFDGLQ